MFDGLTVVFVEDDPTVLAGSEQALQLAGLNVQAFPSAELAYKQLKPDFAGIVVSDVRLPGMSGMDLLKAVKALDTHLPVILVTGHGDITMAVQAMREGAYDFIEKPYSSEQLIEVIVRALDQAGRLLPFMDDVVHVQVTGAAKLLGPDLLTLKGGTTGFWLETTGAVVTSACAYPPAAWASSA